MRIASASVGWRIAVIAVTGNPSVAACMIAPLPFETIKQFKSYPPSLVPSASADRRTVETSTSDLAVTEPQLPPDAAISAIRVPAGSMAVISPNRSVRSKSSPGRRWRISTNAAGVFGVAGPDQPAGSTIAAGRTAAVPVSSTR
jgi:hypothetical protein